MIRAGPDRHGERQRSAAHRLTLALVWLTVASGAVVVAEPAPVDLLSMMLIVLLPAVGLVRLTPALMSLLAAWLVVAAAAFLAAIPALDVARSATHAGISLYLYLAFAVLAGFIARNPAYHTRVVLNAYVLAATGAALAGLAGSLDLISDIAGALTLHDRASGFFKDPNVYGAFLAPAALVAVHIVVTRPLLRSAVGLVVLALLSLALLASFSRGAWLNFAIALAAYGYLSFVTAPLNRQRLRLVALAAIALAGLVAVIAASLATDTLGRRFEERAELTQSYDVGPDGRFGGQAKAWRLIVENPFGIGALTFAPRHHPEDVHNVYLSMMLNAGWLGGLLFAAMMAMTAVLGLAHALRRTATQSLFQVAYGAFLGVAAEGFIVDTDHWRHLYLVMAVVWGLMLGDRRPAAVIATPPGRRRRGLRLRRRPRIVRRARRPIPRPLPAVRRPRRRIPRRPARIMLPLRRTPLN